PQGSGRLVARRRLLRAHRPRNDNPYVIASAAKRSPLKEIATALQVSQEGRSPRRCAPRDDKLITAPRDDGPPSAHPLPRERDKRYLPLLLTCAKIHDRKIIG